MFVAEGVVLKCRELSTTYTMGVGGGGGGDTEEGRCMM